MKISMTVNGIVIQKNGVVLAVMNDAGYPLLDNGFDTLTDAEKEVFWKLIKCFGGEE